MSSLEARITRLETETRALRRSSARWRAAALILGGAMATGALLAQAAPAPIIGDVVKTSRLEIVDAAGNLVLAAGGGPRGGQLDLWSEGGQNIARISGNEHGGDLNLWNRDGLSVVAAWTTEAGGQLASWTGTGDRAARLSAAAEGGRMEVFASGSEVPAGRLAGGPEGGRLEVAASDGTTRLVAEASAGAGRLELKGPGGARVAAIEADADAGGRLVLASAAGARRVLLAADADGGMVTAYDRVDRPVLAAGAGEPGGGGFLDLFAGGAVPLASIHARAEDGGRLDLATQSGQSAFTAQAGTDADGGALVLRNGSGRRGLALAARPEGGLLNVFNRREVAVLVGGYAPAGLGGALSIKNGRGLPVVQAEAISNDTGVVLVADENGESAREVKPLPR